MRQCDFEVPLSVEGIYRGFLLRASTLLHHPTKLFSTHENNLTTMSQITQAASAVFHANPSMFNRPSSHAASRASLFPPPSHLPHLPHTSFASATRQGWPSMNTGNLTPQVTVPPSASGNPSKADTSIEPKSIPLSLEPDGWVLDVAKLSRQCENSTVDYVRSQLASSLT